jgi:hypothetical protein
MFCNKIKNSRRSHKLVFNWHCLVPRGGFVEHLKSILSSTTKCDRNHISHISKLVTPKPQAKHEHVFNEPASEVGY